MQARKVKEATSDIHEGRQGDAKDRKRKYNAAYERRICKRSHQPKINRITNNDTRLILR